MSDTGSQVPEADHQVHTGWLLDLYAEPGGGIVLWFMGEDGGRQRLRQIFPVTFYAAGAFARLRALWRYLNAQTGVTLRTYRCRRRDIFQAAPLDLLAVEVDEPDQQEMLFRDVQERFTDLTFYDADLRLWLRHAAAFSTFPLCRCRLRVAEGNRVTAIEPLESPWDPDLPLPPLRILSLQPDCDPRHGKGPSTLVAGYAGKHWRFPLEPPRPLLVNLAALLRRYDPDILLTDWGDSWLLPRLCELAEEHHLPLPLNRETSQGVKRRPDFSYFSYGQVIHRDQQIHLFGRIHIDARNAMLFHDYGMDGVFELGRVTSLPLQTVARVSPGSGISAMQMVTALRLGILVPWHKQQSERTKTAWQFLRRDQGGMVYQPLVGLHGDVGEIDFISMYPSIMVHCNISPETVVPDLDADGIPLPLAEGLEPGLVPRTLEPLLEKRLELKRRLAVMPDWDPRRKRYKALASAHKWLLVTCFGYLGYRNARFGRIEAHEAVTAYGREALLRAKEAAEELGFTVLHMYVDGLWVQRAGARTVADFQPLLEAVTDCTGLPIALEGIYNWIAFLPSRQDGRVPVANRYFGCFRDGSLKVRGIETRRRDTPRWVAEVQGEVLALLARVDEPLRLPEVLPAVFDLLRQRLAELRSGRVPLELLVVSQKLSRAVEEYRSLSPAGRAALQLKAEGKSLQPGQMVRFLYTRGEPGVFAWDCATPPDGRTIDRERYQTLLLRAACTLLQPLGVDEAALRLQLGAWGVRVLPLWG